MKAIKTERAPAAIGPYSQGVISNGMIFVSGQLPLDPATGILETDPAKAAKRALQNIESILADAGASLADCLKVTIFLTDMTHFSAVNTVYATFFTEPWPARATVAVAGLPKGAILEIECIAALPEGRW